MTHFIKGIGVFDVIADLIVNDAGGIDKPVNQINGCGEELR